MPFKERLVSPALRDLEKLRTPLEPGERKVLDFFHTHLSVEWEIYIQPHLNGLRPDFVLLNPKVGIAVFEVKNWNLSALNYRVDATGKFPRLIGNDGIRDFSLAPSDPVNRIRYYKETIDELFCPRMNKKASYALITAGIIFPSAKTHDVEALLSPLLTHHRMDSNQAKKYYPIAGGEALSSGDVSTVFPESLRRRSGIMKSEYASDLRNWLTEPSISAEQRAPLPLDKRQTEFATTRTGTGYRRIQGPAGSGKSLILAARAGKLIEEGKQVLVVTYNITLLHYLQDLAVRWSEGSRKARKEATWWNFHLWCKNVMCLQAGESEAYRALWRNSPGEQDQPMAKAHLDEILSHLMPQLVSETIDMRPETITRYDAILVDEGQDYQPSWWNCLRKVLKPNGEMVLVADARQDLYGTANKWTDEAMKGAGFTGDWARLSVSYRMPVEYVPFIRKFAEKYVPSELENLPDPKQNPQLELGNTFPLKMKWVQHSSGPAFDSTQ